MKKNKKGGNTINNSFFENLKKLNIKNTRNLKTLKANKGILSVETEGSLILNDRIFFTTIPSALLSENNMADYTSLKLNNLPVPSESVEQVKNGEATFIDGDKIEVLDGCLSGSIFTVRLGIELFKLFPDNTIASHISEKLNIETTDIVTKEMLRTITWLGLNPSSVSATNYKGSLNGKVIRSFEGLNYLENLNYVNFSGAFVPSLIDFSDFKHIKNLNFSFADCTSLLEVIVNGEKISTESTFKNCVTLNKVKIKNFSTNSCAGMFADCGEVSLFEIPKENVFQNENVLENTKIVELKIEAFESLTDTFYSFLDKSEILNLENHKNIKDKQITKTTNSSIKVIKLNNTDFVTLDVLNNPNLSFENLQRVFAENCENLCVVKVKSNIISLSLKESKITNLKGYKYLNLNLLESSYNLNYLTIKINGLEVRDFEKEEILLGKYKFESSCVVEVIGGIFNGEFINVTIYDEYPNEGLNLVELFQDTNIREFFLAKLNKNYLSDKVTEEEFNSITNLNLESSQNFFNRKTLQSLNGIEKIINLSSINFFGATFLIKEINSKTFYNKANFTSLENSFKETFGLTKIDISDFEGLTTLNSAFESSSDLVEILFPKTTSNISTIENVVSNCQNLTLISLEARLETVTTTLESSGLNELISPKRKIKYYKDDTVLSFAELKYHSETGGTSYFNNCIVNYDSLINLPKPLGNIEDVFPDPTLAEYIALKVSKQVNDPLFQSELDVILYFGHKVAEIPSWTPSASYCDFNGKTISNLEGLQHLKNVKYCFFRGATFTESAKNFVFPETWNKLESLLSTFYYCSTLETVILPEASVGITALTSAFYKCTKLTQVNLPNTWVNVRTLSSCFEGCIKLEGINLPETWTSVTMMSSTFQDCQTLTSVSIPSTWVELMNISYLFYNCTNLTSYVLPNSLTKIKYAPYTFGLCVSFTSLSLPETYTELIDIDGLFSKCSNLTTVTLPETWTKVSDAANTFEGCSKLKTVSLPTTWTATVDINNLFKDCVELETIELPESWTKIRLMNYAFQNCKAIKTVTIPSTWKNIEVCLSLFSGCTNLLNVSLPEGCEKITNISSMFSGCSSLKSMTLPNGWTQVTNLYRVFYKCINLDTVVLPPSWSKASALEGFFCGCSAIVEIVMPTTWVNITNLDFAFNDCAQLVTLKLPTTLNLLKTMNQTFLFSTKLMHVELPPSLPLVTTTLTSTYLNSSSSKGRVIKYHSDDSIILPTQIKYHDSITGRSEYTNCVVDYVNLVNLKLPLGVVSELFPDGVLATYIANKVGVTTDTLVFESDLNKIQLFGYNGSSIPTSSPSISFCDFNGKTISNLEGLQHLKNVKYCFFRGATFTDSAKNFVFPETWNKLESLLYTFYDCTNLTSVTLPNEMPSVTNLSSAFRSCTSLTSITLPNEMPSLTDVSSAFRSCTSLTSITLPNEMPNLTSLYYAFQSCTSLTSVTLPNEMPSVTSLSYGFRSCSNLTSITLPSEMPNVTEMSSAFQSCTSLTSVTLPSEMPSLTDVSSAFRSCTSLTSITLPNEMPSVTNLSYAFYYCSSLTSVTLPSEMPNVTDLSSAFYYCSNLASVTLPNEMPSVTNLSSAFYQCSSLTSITLPNEMPSLTDVSSAFRSCTSLTSITLPSEMPSLTNLSSAFYQCSSLTSVTLPSEMPSLTKLGNTFDGCSNLASVTLPNEMPSVNSLSYAFYNCSRLTSVTLPSEMPNVTDLGYTFYGCSNLTSITLPNEMPNVTNWGWAFRSCTSLTSITLPNEMPSVTNLSSAFYQCSSLTSITLPSEMPSLTNLSSAFYQCSSLTSVTLPSEMPSLTKLGNTFDGCSNLASVTLPNEMPSVNSLSYAFYNCSRLTSVTLPSEMPNVTNLSSAFRSCSSLTSITLPSEMPNVTEMSSAFQSCTSLTSVTLPSEMPNVTEMSYAFESCSNLTSITLPALLPLVTTALRFTSLNSITTPTRIIKYHPDDSITSKTQIKYHNALTGIPDYNVVDLDYSALANLPVTNSILDFAESLELANYLGMKLDKDIDYVPTSEEWNSIENLGGEGENSDIDFDINNFKVLSKLENLKTINFKNNKNITSIDFSSLIAGQITTLNSCFYGCENLQNIKLPENLDSLETAENLFYNCNNLKLVTLPAKLKNLKSDIGKLYFDKENVVCEYYENSDIHSTNEITLLPKKAVKNFNSLENCIGVSNINSFPNNIKANIRFVDSDLDNLFELTDDKLVLKSENVKKGVIRLNKATKNKISVTIKKEAETFNLNSSKIEVSFSKEKELSKKIKATVGKDNFLSNDETQYIHFDFGGEVDNVIISSIEILEISPEVIEEKYLNELNYIALNKDEIPTIFQKEKYKFNNVKLNGFNVHSNVAKKLIDGTFELESFQEYTFEPLDGVLKNIKFVCNYLQK